MPGAAATPTPPATRSTPKPTGPSSATLAAGRGNPPAKPSQTNSATAGGAATSPTSATAPGKATSPRANPGSEPSGATTSGGPPGRITNAKTPTVTTMTEDFSGEAHRPVQGSHEPRHQRPRP